MEREEVLSQLRERIVAFAASRTERDVAEDLAQEVLMLLEDKYSHVTAIDQLVPLSLQIVKFKLVAHRRKAHRRGESSQLQIDDLPIADLGPDPEQVTARRELLDRLKVEAAQLGERCREIFRLKLLGRTFAEIQRELKAESIKTVYTWDARCRKQLLERLGGSWERRK